MSDPTPTASTVDGPGRQVLAVPSDPAGGVAGRLRAWWSAVVGVIGTVVGLVPHVLHHIGLLAGTALVAGGGGTALFGALGLVASVPLLLRLFGTWWAPAVGLVVFVVMFSVSAFIVGPAINGGADGPPRGRATEPVGGPGQPPPLTRHVEVIRDGCGDSTPGRGCV